MKYFGFSTVNKIQGAKIFLTKNYGIAENYIETG